jgi:predicted GH43/DUF377 family glycosyl hydrolase
MVGIGIKWKKLGLVIQPKKSLFWSKSHCMVPTPFHIKGGLYRIFFSGRDENNISHVGYATIDLDNPSKLVDYATNPILSPGCLGCFDDNGVTPSCILDLGNGELAMYYIGWNPGSTVRMHLFGGMAISSDGGDTFERWSQAPILERCLTDPYLNTAPWVVKVNKEYRIYYVSGNSWVNKDLPRYNIKMGYSKDGKNWIRGGHVCIDFKDNTESALARPYVIFEDNVWKMWFAHKGESYRLGYAESLDGIDWERQDEMAGISVSANGFDSEMVEYAAVVKHDGRHFMFYNGNNYGLDGIGLAIEEL